MQKDSLNIMSEFRDVDGDRFMMLEDGSVYWVSYGEINPITRSFYGHVLKLTRKRVLQNMAELYRERSLAKKSRNHLEAHHYDKSIKSYQAMVDEYNAAWSQFREYMAAQKAIRKLDKFEKFPEKAARYYAKQ